MAKSVGILTGGGDCPGLNAVIRAVVRRADAAGWDVVAVREGGRGLVEPIFEDLVPQRVVGVKGRQTGWVAVMSGIACGADVILVPESPVDFGEVAETSRKRHARGKNFSIGVVSEGCELPGLADAGEQDQFGHVILARRGVGDALGREIEERTGFETRVTVLGHVQRGGSPTPRDRVLATRFGLKAADLALAGEFGQMAALRGDDVVA